MFSLSAVAGERVCTAATVVAGTHHTVYIGVSEAVYTVGTTQGMCIECTFNQSKGAKQDQIE